MGENLHRDDAVPYVMRLN